MDLIWGGIYRATGQNLNLNSYSNSSTVAEYQGQFNTPMALILCRGFVGTKTLSRTWVSGCHIGDVLGSLDCDLLLRLPA